MVLMHLRASPGIFHVDRGRLISDQRRPSLVRHTVKIRKQSIEAAMPSAEVRQAMKCGASAYDSAG